MRKVLSSLGKLLFGTRRRMVLSVFCALVLCKVLLVWVGRRNRADREVPPGEIGIGFFEEQPWITVPRMPHSEFPLGTDGLSNLAALWLRGVSADGKWLTIGRAGYTPNRLFFNAENGRFTGYMIAGKELDVIYTFPRAVRESGWLPNRYPIYGERRRSTDRFWDRLRDWLPGKKKRRPRFGSYLVDLKTRRAWATSKVEFERYFPPRGCVAVLNDGRTRVFVQKRNLQRYAYYICPYRIENLRLVDALGTSPPRTIPVASRFESLTAEDEASSAIHKRRCISYLAFVDQDRTVRLMEALRPADRRDPALNKVRVWDLQLETGDLKRVMDLPCCSWLEDPPVFSPSAASAVVATTSALVVSQVMDLGRGGDALLAARITTTSLTYYAAGHEPRPLPFHLGTWRATVFHPGGPLPWPAPISDAVRFLDENTLVYVANRVELWTFDLRTWKSQLLWRPGAAGPQTDIEKRTTDKRGASPEIGRKTNETKMVWFGVQPSGWLFVLSVRCEERGFSSGIKRKKANLKVELRTANLKVELRTVGRSRERLRRGQATMLVCFPANQSCPHSP